MRPPVEQHRKHDQPRALRIAQIAPPFEPVPPPLYGGTERVIAHLTEALVAAGHDVTLFAAGGSSTSARQVTTCPDALRLVHRESEEVARTLVLNENLVARASEFDVIHCHNDLHGLPLARRVGVPVVTTLHGRLDLPQLAPVFDEFREAAVVSVSDQQRTPLLSANWVGTVHHGLPRHLYPFRPRSDGYLAFVGRISREKRLDRAIAIARAVGRRLVVAAKIDDADRAYVEREIEPLLGDDIEYLGEVDDAHKAGLLGGAAALIFAVDWPEPFGLVMIEALACGTPVVAMRRGSVPEVLEHGVTGFVCDTLEQAIADAERIDDIDRAACRAAFEDRFTVERMRSDYEAIYDRLVARRQSLAS